MCVLFARMFPPPPPFVAAQFVRGDFPTHFAVELGAEERHAEAQLKRDPLFFRRKG